jgi:hypothetical protein
LQNVIGRVLQGHHVGRQVHGRNVQKHGG